MAKKKVTLKVAIFGLLGLSSLAYAVIRPPRHLYDGKVAACEGGADCESLVLKRGTGSGKLFAPSAGRIVESSDGKIVFEMDHEPVRMIFTFPITAQKALKGPVKAGALILQADEVAVRSNRNGKPMATTAWLVTNSIAPASIKGTGWCEDNTQLIVPKCAGVEFETPTLPKYSLRNIRVTQ